MPQPPSSRSIWPHFRENRLFTVLLAIVLVYASVWFLTSIRLNVERADRVGKADQPPRTITVEGSGKVTTPPTIARITVGLVTEGGTDVAATQKQNTAKMNALLQAIKSLGIPDADLQTANYTIYPRYDYSGGSNRLVGYTVSQIASVKVRDLAKVSSVFQKAGETGANQVNGPDFTLDDPERTRAEARAKAIKNAEDNAAELARALGVRIVRVVGFTESGGGGRPIPYDLAKLGMEGAQSAPQIESGTLDVLSNVSVTYEIE